ncbi:MAG: DcaP family trimeric outer membrane transporter [Thermoanaerobaculia bacterium]
MTLYSKPATVAAVALSLLVLGTTVASATESQPSDKPQEAEPDWPGSFSLFGSQTRLAVGGFVQLDVIYDSDAIGAPCQFITATIPTDGGTPAEGADGQTNFCINTSRLTFESRTPTKLGRLKTFISVDLFGDALSTSPELRMRQAYGELSGALGGGDLLFGQSWGTYVDLDAWPDILDFEGPDSAIAVRQPMVRWSKGVAKAVDLRVALEQPGDGSVQDADLLTRWPDLVGTVRWTHGGSHLRGGGILRDIRASAADGASVAATGWGVAGSGKVMLPAKSDLVFEVSYGEGVGAYYNDGPPAGVYDPETSSLELLPLFAYYAAFEHDWSETLSSSLLYAALEVDNLESQQGVAGKKSAYFSLNLIWRPDPRLMFGIEFLSGGRRDKDDAEGTVNRLQLSSQFSF